MLQLSPPALAQVTALIQGPNPNYPAAYQAVLKDLNSQYPNGLPAGADADSLQWVNVALQVNSGANTLDAVAIRASNAAADQLLNGTSIALFGPEEQASSDAVAAAFFRQVTSPINPGVIPPLNGPNGIAAIDAGAGLTSLGLPPSAWAGAVPDPLSQVVAGFTTNNYYENLSAAEQQQADAIHLISIDVAATYLTASNLPLVSTYQVNAATSFVAAQESQIVAALPPSVVSAMYAAYDGLAIAYNAPGNLYNALKSYLSSSSSSGTDQGGDIPEIVVTAYSVLPDSINTTIDGTVYNINASGISTASPVVDGASTIQSSVPGSTPYTLTNVSAVGFGGANQVNASAANDEPIGVVAQNSITAKINGNTVTIINPPGANENSPLGSTFALIQSNAQAFPSSVTLSTHRAFEWRAVMASSSCPYGLAIAQRRKCLHRFLPNAGRSRHSQFGKPGVVPGWR